MKQILLVLTLCPLLCGGCRGSGAAAAAAETKADAGPADQSVVTHASASSASSEIAAPARHELTVPAGTRLSVRLASAVSSDRSHVEDAVRGTLARAIEVHGATAIPAGSEVVGAVTAARESGRVKGKARVSFRFTRLIVAGDSHAIHTASVTRLAASSRKGDLKSGGIGAGAGAVVGGLIGGKKGALIGAGAGGTGAVLATKGKEVRLGPGAIVSTTLQQPVTLDR